jgi:hypothetical protein
MKATDSFSITIEELAELENKDKTIVLVIGQRISRKR